MTVALDYQDRKPAEGWFRRAESWLDDRGKPAWIAMMVLGFVFFWPVGLAILFYMIFSKRMFAGGCGRTRARSGFDAATNINRRHGFRSSGNTAFDAYKAETLQRLMDEQEQFESFLDRLRTAKDKREFDAFMNERAEAARSGVDTEDETDAEDTHRDGNHEGDREARG